MDDTLAQQVWQRAKATCEYCRLPPIYSLVSFEIDHIFARKHGGPTRLSNLCLSCFYCNSFKGSDLSGLDPATGRITRLFHPRRHSWAYHFRWDGPTLIGRTPIGRTTIAVLQINQPLRVALRATLIEAGEFPA